MGNSSLENDQNHQNKYQQIKKVNIINNQKFPDNFTKRNLPELKLSKLKSKISLETDNESKEDGNNSIQKIKPINNIRKPKSRSQLKNRDVIFPKSLRNHNDILLHFSWKSIISFCSNNNLEYSEIQFKTIKSFTNLKFISKKELNVIYKNGLGFYYIPMNFRTLFMDKTRYFDVNLKAKLINNQNIQIKYKDINSHEKILEIKKNEITIFQYFRENVYYEQSNFGEIIKKLREENPKVKIKYYLIILTAGDHFKNSIFYDKVKSHIEKFTLVEDVLFFSYIIDEFCELTKYCAVGRNMNILGLRNELVNFELIPDKIEKMKELLIYYVNKLLLKSYEKEINKRQYELLKETWRDFLDIKEHNKDKTLFEIELSKTKYFDKKETKYIFKCYNHEKKVWDDNKENKSAQIKEIGELKLKINKILEQTD